MLLPRSSQHAFARLLHAPSGTGLGAGACLYSTFEPARRPRAAVLSRQRPGRDYNTTEGGIWIYLGSYAPATPTQVNGRVRIPTLGIRVPGCGKNAHMWVRS